MCDCLFVCACVGVFVCMEEGGGGHVCNPFLACSPSSDKINPIRCPFFAFGHDGFCSAISKGLISILH